jgi:hypothetical protein
MDINNTVMLALAFATCAMAISLQKKYLFINCNKVVAKKIAIHKN